MNLGVAVKARPNGFAARALLHLSPPDNPDIYRGGIRGTIGGVVEARLKKEKPNSTVGFVLIHR